MLAKQNSRNSPKERMFLGIIDGLNVSFDALMEIGKVRALVVQQVLDPYRNKSLEEICGEAFGSRFGGKGPVDLYGEVRAYIGGEKHFRGNLSPCEMHDAEFPLTREEGMQDYVCLWIFGDAPESRRNTILKRRFIWEDSEGNPDPADQKGTPYLDMGEVRYHPKYIFLGDPDLVNPDKDRLQCMLDALFFPGVLEERRLALLRRCGLGLTGPEEERVRTATRNIQVEWERLAVWKERYGQGS